MRLIHQSTFSGDNMGISAELITLRNVVGMVTQFTNYGARWVSMWVPDREGKQEDVLLGFDTVESYRKAGEQYHGAIVGRVCGRINKARFTLAGTEYRLAGNDAYGYPERNHLHGGIQALHNRMWQGWKEVNETGEEVAVFSLCSPDGEEGYPGNLHLIVTYTLQASGALIMKMEATTDKQTPVNLTNHVFFNLQGNRSVKNILSHRLTLNASALIVCNKDLIPTGSLLPTTGTSLDFSTPRTIGSSLLELHSQIQSGKGFSIAYALQAVPGKVNFAARLEDDTSGRQVEIYTNQPSIQVYNGYFMDGTDIGKNDTLYYPNAGIALETQGYPDAPNQNSFPSILLNKGERYCHITEYHFSTKIR